MKVLALTKYSRLGASSRLRTLQYLPYLAEHGVSVEVAPLFDDDYLRNLYAGRSNARRIPGYLLGRMRTMRRARGYDALWIEKEALPWTPFAIEAALLPRGVPIVVDYDDAVFHNYDRHRLAPVRALLGTKIDRVMRRAEIVIAGSRYLADRARAVGARRVEQIPTVVDLDRYPPGDRPARDRPVIGWMGSPSTAGYLREFDASGIGAGADWIAVGANPDQVAGTPFRAVPWNEQSEAALLKGFDIGLMQLPDTDWARGKCGYKLIQYMASSVPVVASAVGANRDIVRDGTDGYLVEDAAGWRRAIADLLADSRRRAAMGRAGRERVEREYSLQAQAPRLLEVLRSLL